MQGGASVCPDRQLTSVAGTVLVGLIFAILVTCQGLPSCAARDVRRLRAWRNSRRPGLSEAEGQLSLSGLAAQFGECFSGVGVIGT